MGWVGAWQTAIALPILRRCLKLFDTSFGIQLMYEGAPVGACRPQWQSEKHYLQPTKIIYESYAGSISGHWNLLLRGLNDVKICQQIPAIVCTKIS